jgi:hypothetical protein
MALREASAGNMNAQSALLRVASLLLSAIVLAAAGACDNLAGSDRILEVGGCCGVEVGQSQAEVISGLKHFGVTSGLSFRRKHA